MKIALAQINSTIADFAGNVRRISEFYRRANDAGAELVVFPELAVSGYPPRDLLERSSFIDSNLEAIEKVAELTVGGAGIICGFIERNDRTGKGRPLFNSAAVCDGGKIIGRARKSLLPTYDVFDEDRHFQPAPEISPIQFRGKKLGVTICEDIWSEIEFGVCKLYNCDPAVELAEAGADIIINISASPYYEGKISERRSLLAAAAGRTGLPIVYLNCIGANDELIFDGHSFVIDRAGEIICRGAGFVEELLFVDPESCAGDLSPQTGDETEQVVEALRLGIADYVGKTGHKKVVLGLSGGIDSALVAALAARALGPENVFALLMPSMYSSEGSISDSEKLAKNLGIAYHICPITDIYNSYAAALEPIFDGAEPNVAEENIQARIRGDLLMAYSNKFGALLLATGNKSELAVGYCTLYGDMCGGLAPIGDLTKQSVYRVARWFNREAEIIPEAILTKPPSAELRPNQTDQDSLPEYDILDGILVRYIADQAGRERIIAEGFDRETVDRIIGMIDKTEYKRRQAPPVLKVTSKAFGPGRRLPIARGWSRVEKD